MKLLSTLLSVLALVACTAYSPTGVQPGQTAEDVARAMGAPTARYPLPDGTTRLEYARGPAGRETYMIDLDASGKVVDWTQVLTEQMFLVIDPGMPEHQLLITLGTPASVYAIPRQQLKVWNYRYRNNDCLWFQVSVGDDGKVVAAGHGNEELCDGPNDRR
jgi:hypothetical protein